MEKENTNVLRGMKCPTCGSLGPYRIGISTIILFTDEGEDFLADKGADKEWTDHSYCECCKCGHAATVCNFTIQPPFTHKHQRAFNQVLAALRFWQQTFPNPLDIDEDRWSEYFSDEGYLAMTPEEIDALCESLTIDLASEEA